MNSSKVRRNPAALSTNIVTYEYNNLTVLQIALTFALY